jgi:hypothetical protein
MIVTLDQILADIHALEEELLEFERKYGLRSETFYAAYVGGEEAENDAWVLDFSEWASIYKTWLARQGADPGRSARASMPGLRFKRKAG